MTTVPEYIYSEAHIIINLVKLLKLVVKYSETENVLSAHAET